MCILRTDVVTITESDSYIQRIQVPFARQVLSCEPLEGFEIIPENDAIIVENNARTGWYDIFEVNCDYCVGNFVVLCSIYDNR